VEQIGCLQEFLKTKLQRVNARLLAPMHRRSAVIWWRVPPNCPE
jgi:hypothetical protein